MNNLYDKIINIIIIIAEFLSTTYLGAFIVLLMSIKTIKDSLKNEETIDTPYFILGWLGAIMGICFSIHVFICKILGKL